MKNLVLLLACLLSSRTVMASTDEHLDGSARGLDALDIVCAGRQVAYYSPGLTLQPREVTISSAALLSTCVSPTHPGILSGVLVPTSATMVQNCLLSNSNPTRTVRWNTGQSTTFAIALTVNLKPDGTSVISGTGTVIDGLFKGARIEQVVVLPNTSFADCFTERGLTEAAGAVTFVITPLLTP